MKCVGLEREDKDMLDLAGVHLLCVQASWEIMKHQSLLHAVADESEGLVVVVRYLPSSLFGT